MRICNASLSDPFDSSLVLFPESTHPDHLRSRHSLLTTPGDSPAAPLGSWRYTTRRTRQKVMWLAAICSLGVHAVPLLAFNAKRVEAHRNYEPLLPVTLMNMPASLEDREEKLEDVDRWAEAGGGVDAPRQVEIPTIVVLENMMTQRFDPRTLQPHLSLTDTKLVTIPGNLRVGGTGEKGFKDIFDLADVDQLPSPVFQPRLYIPAPLRIPGADINLTVEFIVNNKGKVVDARVIQSTDRRYDDITIANVMKWQFKPGKKKDRAVAVLIDQPFVITLTSDQ